jgi:hypothetical protein
MVKLSKIIKWYLRTIIVTPVYEVVILVVVLVQYASLFLSSSYFMFIFDSSILSFPITAVFVGSGIFRDKSIRIFELNLFQSRRRISLGKMIAAFLTFIPIFLINFLLLVYFNDSFLIIPSILSLLIIFGVMLLSALYNSTNQAIITTIMFSFLLPLSIEALLNNYANMGARPNLVIESFSYIFSPLFAFYFFKGGVISIAPVYGFLFSFLFALFLVCIYLLFTDKFQIKP